ncbi:MAG: hypothetical protein U0838_06740 [Chloroflexota bacterium]
MNTPIAWPSVVFATSSGRPEPPSDAALIATISPASTWRTSSGSVQVVA